MAEVITRFRVNCNGVEQDAQYCYKNLANKPTFKTINGKFIVVSTGDTETDFKLATAEETAALRTRVANLEQNGTGGGGGSGGDLSNYVDKSSVQTITGSKRFSGNVEIIGKLWDKELNAGSAGQILSSTGSGVEWVDAPSGGGISYAEMKEYVTEAISTALAAIPVAEGGAY